MDGKGARVRLGEAMIRYGHWLEFDTGQVREGELFSVHHIFPELNLVVLEDEPLDGCTAASLLRAFQLSVIDI